VLKNEPFPSECWSMSRPLAPRLLAVLGRPAEYKTAEHRLPLPVGSSSRVRKRTVVELLVVINAHALCGRSVLLGGPWRGRCSNRPARGGSSRSGVRRCGSSPSVARRGESTPSSERRRACPRHRRVRLRPSPSGGRLGASTPAHVLSSAVAVKVFTFGWAAGRVDAVERETARVLASANAAEFSAFEPSAARARAVERLVSLGERFVARPLAFDFAETQGSRSRTGPFVDEARNGSRFSSWLGATWLVADARWAG